MAGNQHHHIWKMLQKGFAVEEFGGHHVWVHTKDGPPYRTTTKLHGKEKYYYSTAADENITAHENILQDLVHEARRAGHGTAVDPDMCASLVCMLEMRSHFLRRELTRTAVTAISSLNNHFSNPKSIEKFYSNFIAKRPQIIEELLRERGATDDVIRLINAYIQCNRTGFVEMMASIPGSAEAMSALSRALIDRMHSTVKDSHNRSLEGRFSGTKRAELHAKLKYFVHKSSEPLLILPDTGIAVFSKGRITPISDKALQIETIVIPLSPNTSIIGRGTTYTEKSPTTLSRALAGCAHQSFIHPFKHVKATALGRRIGQYAYLISDLELRQIVDLD